jgi:zeaxanthin glucosyltransferase
MPLRVAIYVVPEQGHLNPTFPLARALARRGHEVVYLTTFGMEALVASRGFRCVVVHRDSCPRGTFAELQRLAPALRQAAEGGFHRARYRDFVVGKMDRPVQDLEPDVIVADIVPGLMVLLAHRLGIPVVPLSTMVAVLRQDERPPLNCALPPSASPLELAAANERFGCLHEKLGPVATPSAHAFRIETAAMRFGYPRAQLSFESTLFPSLTLYPEAVIGPAALDFPRARAGGATYLGVPVDAARDEEVPEVLTRFVDPARPLVFASLGSQPGRYREERRFFDSVLGAASIHRECQVVVSTGEAGFEAVANAAPSNVLVLRWTPQMWLLKRAAVFVTHAGFGSYREGVAAHVPMIAVPQSFDQPGNAARIAYHRVGLHVAPNEISAARLASMIEAILTDAASFRERLEKLDQACRAEQAEERGAAVVEAAALGRLRAAVAAPALPAAVAAREPKADGATVGWMFARASGDLRALASSAELRAAGDEPLGVGSGGVTVCTELVEALVLGGGPLLVRVAATGEVLCAPPHLVARTLQCLWTVDLTEVLHAFAAWCAEITVPEARRPSVREQIGRHRALLASGAREEAGALASSLLADADWNDGGAAAACATFGDARLAAQMASDYAADTWARRRVGDAEGTAAGGEHFDRARADLVRTLEVELRARVTAFALTRGIVVERT